MLRYFIYVVKINIIILVFSNITLSEILHTDLPPPLPLRIISLYAFYLKQVSGKKGTTNMESYSSYSFFHLISTSGCRMWLDVEVTSESFCHVWKICYEIIANININVSGLSSFNIWKCDWFYHIFDAIFEGFGST